MRFRIRVSRRVRDRGRLRASATVGISRLEHEDVEVCCGVGEAA